MGGYGNGCNRGLASRQKTLTISFEKMRENNKFQGFTHLGWATTHWLGDHTSVGRPQYGVTTIGSWMIIDRKVGRPHFDM